MSLIGSIYRLDSLGMIDSQMRYKPAALSTVSSVGYIFSRFVPNVPCTRYVVYVSICSCNVGGFSFISSSSVTACILVILMFSLASLLVSCFSISLCAVIVEP